MYDCGTFTGDCFLVLTYMFHLCNECTKQSMAQRERATHTHCRSFRREFAMKSQPSLYPRSQHDGRTYLPCHHPNVRMKSRQENIRHYTAADKDE